MALRTKNVKNGIGDSAARLASPRHDPLGMDLAGQKVLEAAIGREVRDIRKKHGITVADLATATGLSLGMLSKIENGVTSPSLTTLQSISRALGIQMTDLFRRFEENHEVVLVKAGEGSKIERRGTKSGHRYNLLGRIKGSDNRLVVEPYLITLTAVSDKFPAFQHDGLEFLYMIEGEMTYRHGEGVYPMKPGDSLFFDAGAPHGPERMISLPIRFLCVASHVGN